MSFDDHLITTTIQVFHSSSSLAHLVISTLSENTTPSRLEEGLLCLFCVCDLIGELSWSARKRGLFSRVLRELVDFNSLTGEVQLDVVEVLSLVETDLDAASTSADALHVVLVELSRDHVSST